MSFSSLRTTFLTGAVLLIPIGAIVYFGILIFNWALFLAEPVVNFFDIQDVASFIILNVLALASVVVVCLLAGFAARMAFVSSRVQKLDQTLAKVVPGYSMAVGALKGTISEDAGVEALQPVIVRVGNMLRIGFEIERTPDNQVAVFLPNAPSAQVGVTGVFQADAVTSTNLPPHRVFEMMQLYGKGLAPMLKQTDYQAAQE